MLVETQLIGKVQLSGKESEPKQGKYTVKQAQLRVNDGFPVTVIYDAKGGINEYLRVKSFKADYVLTINNKRLRWHLVLGFQ